MTTRERIMDEALTLFSMKGFKGTSINNIAEAVGIKGSSLYKHFKNKQEIFDTVVIEMRKRIESMSALAGLPHEHTFQEDAKAYGELTLEGLTDLSKKIFLFYLKDSFVSRFWKMASIERYQNQEIYAAYQHIFMEESLVYQTRLFKEMILLGYFIEANAEAMAMNFYAPIFFLLSKYMNEPEKETEALNMLEKQVEEFYRIYRKQTY